MAFTLQQVVPWGRTMDEYIRMFRLTEAEMNMKIASFGDGPASFQKEMHEAGRDVHSYDPIYQFPREQLEQRIEEVREEVMIQMEENQDNFVWKDISNLAELEQLRMHAMRQFLADYEKGREEGRYIAHELPERIACEDQSYDLGLSSHFLLMYTMLGYEFHIEAISEMLRVCSEVRIFPVLTLNAEESALTEQMMAYFSRDYDVELIDTLYEFQKGGNQMMRIRRIKE